MSRGRVPLTAGAGDDGTRLGGDALLFPGHLPAAGAQWLAKRGALRGAWLGGVVGRLTLVSDLPEKRLIQETAMTLMRSH